MYNIIMSRSIVPLKHVCHVLLRCGPDMSGARAVAGLGTSLLELSQKLRCSFDALDGLEGAAAAAATFKPSSASMSILVFEIAPINWFQTACVC